MQPVEAEAVAEMSVPTVRLRKQQTIEVLVFLSLIVPSLILSLFVVRQGNFGFTLTALSVIFRDLALVALVLFFLWRNGEPTQRVGWRFEDAWREILLAVVLFVPFFFAANWLEQVLLRLGMSTPPSPEKTIPGPHGPAETVLAVVLVGVVAVAEETIFRGYLLLRLAAASGSMSMAVVLSSVIFALGHGYEGSVGLVTVGAMGLGFALVYLWRQSLVTPIMMHFFQDFLAIVLLPLLFQK